MGWLSDLFLGKDESGWYPAENPSIVYTFITDGDKQIVFKHVFDEDYCTHIRGTLDFKLWNRADEEAHAHAKKVRTKGLRSKDGRHFPAHRVYEVKVEPYVRCERD